MTTQRRTGRAAQTADDRADAAAPAPAGPATGAGARATTADDATSGGAGETGGAAKTGRPAGPMAAAAVGDIASGRDEAGVPIHHGWAPLSGRRRWMEPFLLVIMSGGSVHGYAIIGRLEEMGIADGPIDVGQVYRTLRELEGSGLVTSAWSVQPQGPARRDYELSAAGYTALDEWAAVMKERARLIGEFEGQYLEWIARDRRPRG